MTSNVGASKITDSRQALGFGDDKDAAKTIEDLVMEELKKTFKPEFLNRVDEIVVFNQLEKQDIQEIARRMLKALNKRLADLDVQATFTDAAVDALADKGFDKVYGARPLRRAIQTQIEDPLSELLLEDKIHGTVTVDYKDGAFTFDSPIKTNKNSLRLLLQTDPSNTKAPCGLNRKGQFFILRFVFNPAAAQGICGCISPAT